MRAVSSPLAVRGKRIGARFVDSGMVKLTLSWLTTQSRQVVELATNAKLVGSLLLGVGSASIALIAYLAPDQMSAWRALLGLLIGVLLGVGAAFAFVRARDGGLGAFDHDGAQIKLRSSITATGCASLRTTTQSSREPGTRTRPLSSRFVARAVE